MPQCVYEFEGLRLDPGQRRLEGQDGEPLTLTAKPFDALVHLIEHAGEPVSRRQLSEVLWPNTIVEDNNLTQTISTLRGTIGKRCIATLPGRGYQFVGDVRRVGRDSGTADARRDDASAQHHRAQGADSGRIDAAWPRAPARWQRATGAVVIVALLGLVLGFLLVGHRLPDSEPSVLPNSIAVLPLENLSANPNNAYYAAGLHEEILNRLSKVKRLNVIARTSVLRFAKNRPPIPEIAKELHAQTVMEGSVRFDGERIRVAVQLIDGHSGEQMWTQSYDSNFGDVFGVEADIATNVADSLSLRFSLDEKVDLHELPTGSSEAYALYLRAWNTAGIAVRHDEFLDQAIAIDPNFALARALKALVNSRRLINVAGVEAVDPAQRSGIEAIVLKNATRDRGHAPGATPDP